MAKYTSRQRKRLPNSAFLLPFDRKLPYKDWKGNISLSHVRNALARANQVTGVPQKEIDAAVRKAEKILLEHGGYENEMRRNKGKMRPNFFGRKPKAPPTPAELEEQRIQRMRDSEEWKNYFRFWNISEKKPRAEAMQRADASYEDYHKALAKKRETGIMRNPRRRRGMRRNGSSSVQLYANPYDTSVTGFYFDDFAEFEKKYAAQYRKTRTEEYEIDFINGDDLEQALFDAMGVSQANLEEYFELVDQLSGMSDAETAAVIFLMEDRSMSASEAIERAEDVMLFEGSLEDAAADYLESIGEVDANTAAMYFDYDSFGRDLAISGDDVAGTIEQIEELQSSGDESDLEEAESLQEWVDEIESKSDEDRAYEFIDSIGGLEEAVGPDALARYFDYAAFGRDADMNGDWSTFRHGGTDYVVLNAAEF